MLFLPRPPVFSDKYIIIKELVFSRPHLTPPVRPPIDLTFHLPSCRPDFRLILFPLAHSGSADLVGWYVHANQE